MTPALSWPIIAAVLFGALLHASWNALIKSGDDKALDTALIHVLGCGVGAALVVWVGLPRREALLGKTFDTRKMSSRRPAMASAITSSASPYISAVSM